MSDVITEQQPTERRWEPIGAPNDSCVGTLASYEVEENELKILKRDKDLLSSSLFAMTTHLAQVQLRLRQIIYASPETKEELLESLEEFACRGIPDVGIDKERRDEVTLIKEIQLKRNQERQIFNEVKEQLVQFEEYAFKNTKTISYDNVLVQRYKVIINELKTKINLQINHESLSVMAPDNINKEVNRAIDQLLAPLKIKDRLVSQLKTQIMDLERFVQFLQTSKRGCHNASPGDELSAFKVIYKIVNVLEILANVQISCLNKQFQTTKCKEKEYSVLQLELKQNVDRIRKLIEESQKVNTVIKSILNYTHDTDLTQFIRTSMAISLKKLIEHGTFSSSNNNLVPFTSCCLPISDTSHLNAWGVFLKYYDLQIKLSPNIMIPATLLKSFDLDTSQISPREELLWYIKALTREYKWYNMNTDCQFADLICIGLNFGKLVTWFRLIFTNKQLIKECYETWSYVAMTGFQDSMQTLDTLAQYHFNIPVNIAVKHFQNIKDVFY